MASSGGTSSGSSLGSEGDMVDERKRKRMISNRESARRSRMRKQKHLDDLAAQVAQLRNENQMITSSVSVTTQNFLTIDAENSVLRAQLSELSHRLDSLNEIINFLNTSTTTNNNSNNSNGGFGFGFGFGIGIGIGDHHGHHNYHDPGFSAFGSDNNSFINNPLNMMCLNQPIMASADIFDQY